MTSKQNCIVLPLIFVALVTLFSWAKMSFIIGTHTGSFSLVHSIVPLIGILGGSLASVIFMALRTGLKLYCATAATHVLLACYLPTTCAALYFACIAKPQTKIFERFARLVFAGVMMLCMLLFCIHPVGSHAAAYALFWFIPLGIIARAPHSFFWHALTSSFVAHAVGSVLWLYAGLIPEPSVWLGLMPIVALERLVMSMGTTVAYNAVNATATFLRARTTKLYRSFLPH